MTAPPSAAPSLAQVEIRAQTWPELTEYFVEPQPIGFINLSLRTRPPSAVGDYVWSAPKTCRIGNMLYVPPGQPFRASIGQSSDLTLTCRLDASRIPDTDDVPLSERLLGECLDIRSPLVLGHLRRIAAEVETPDFASPLMIEAQSVMAFTELARHLSRMAGRDPNCGGLAPWRMKLIRQRLRDEDALPSIGELADLCRMSRRHLARVFKAATGQTLSAHIRDAGVEKATRWLIQDDRPIRDIARALGFASPSSFTLAYQRATGRAPSDVRRAR